MNEYISGSELINIPMDDGRTIKKTLKIIGNSMALIGILGVIGTAGGLDQNRIELIPGFIQMGLFMMMGIAGIIPNKIKSISKKQISNSNLKVNNRQTRGEAV